MTRTGVAIMVGLVALIAAGFLLVMSGAIGPSTACAVQVCAATP